MNQWLWASTILIALEIPLLGYSLWAPRIDALVAYETAATLFALSLITLAEGFHRTAYTILAVVACVLNFVSGMVYLRFFERELDP